MAISRPLLPAERVARWYRMVVDIGDRGVFGCGVRVARTSMSERAEGEGEPDPPDQAEVEAVESGDVEPGNTAEEVERAAEREEEALEG